MVKEFNKRLANERRKWGVVVLFNVGLILVFPQKNSVFNVLPVQFFFKCSAAQPQNRHIN